MVDIQLLLLRLSISPYDRNLISCVCVHYGCFSFFLIGIDLKKASKSFAQHFSCGSSVTGDDEIVIQGDVSYDIIDFIQKKWPEVNIMMFYVTSSYYILICARWMMILYLLLMNQNDDRHSLNSCNH